MQQILFYRFRQILGLMKDCITNEIVFPLMSYSYSYGEYEDLCGILHKYIKPTHHALVIGSNNATLGENLYDVGYRSMVCVDSNESAVKKLAARNEAERPEMTFVNMEMSEVRE